MALEMLVPMRENVEEIEFHKPLKNDVHPENTFLTAFHAPVKIFENHCAIPENAFLTSSTLCPNHVPIP